MKRVISLILSLSFIFALVPTMTLSVNAANEPLCFTANVAGSTVKLVDNNVGGSGSAEYSTDGSNWSSYTFNDTIITLNNAGDKVYFRGNDVCGAINFGFMAGIIQYYRFVMTGSITASGNVNSLINYVNDISTIGYCFWGLFQDCSALTNAKKLKLPAENLSDYCYSFMFHNCVSLTDAPELLAATLKKGCYANMFRDCKSLKEIPKLEAKNLADECYTRMFQNCTSLESIPTLPATTLKENCYEAMFMGCSSLKNPPMLPAMSLTDSCYSYMFYECNELESTPKLPATTLANYCYYFMFSGCTSLIYATTLPASNLARECYKNMFKNCSSLMIVTDTNGHSGYDGVWSFNDYGSFDPLYGMIEGTKNTLLLSQLNCGTLLTGTNYYFKLSPYCLEQSEEIFDLEADPETDIVIGNTAYTFKYGNETVVIDENYYRDITESNNIFFEVDFSKANAKIDTTIIPNKVIKLINDAGKGIMFKDKYAHAVIDRPVMDNNNSTVIKLAEGIASYAQVKAMNTTHVEAEVEVEYKSNGKSLDGDVKVYVPCDLKEARVFYVIDEHTIGEWPCEVVDGYCVFDRYKDGTYVVCK